MRAAEIVKLISTHACHMFYLHVGPPILNLKVLGNEIMSGKSKCVFFIQYFDLKVTLKISYIKITRVIFLKFFLYTVCKCKILQLI